ncbi:MAG: cation:proton antiporter [Actinomycetota bacterium]|nr:cation:proton antiporter [Actinomycetota bacterium]
MLASLPTTAAAEGTHAAALLIQLGAVLFVLGLLGRLARLVKVPVIPLYLLAGLAFGQGGFASLSASREFISVAAEIGVILLLLMLGLEYSAGELLANLRTQAPVGALDAVLNAGPGAAVALIAGWGPLAAVALAGITWVSSSGVIAKVLSDLGRLGNRETPSILGVLVVEDLSMAIYLPLLTALLAGTGVGGVTLAVVIALVTVTVVLIVATRFGVQVTRLVSTDDAESLLLGTLGLTVLVAGIAQELNVSSAVGAFLVGIALSGTVAETAVELLTPIRDLFAAAFFVFFGLSTAPHSLPGVLALAGLLAVVGTATKVATGYVAAARGGARRRGRWRAGVALVPRGEFSVVVAALAVQAGAEPRLGPLTACYVLLTIIIGAAISSLPDRLNATPPRRWRGQRAVAVAS